MTWRVYKQKWVAGYSLHRSAEDAFAFTHQHQDSPNKPSGDAKLVNVSKSDYDKVYASRYGIWKGNA